MIFKYDVVSNIGHTIKRITLCNYTFTYYLNTGMSYDIPIRDRAPSTVWFLRANISIELEKNSLHKLKQYHENLQKI